MNRCDSLSHARRRLISRWIILIARINAQSYDASRSDSRQAARFVHVSRSAGARICIPITPLPRCHTNAINLCKCLHMRFINVAVEFARSVFVATQFTREIWPAPSATIAAITAQVSRVWQWRHCRVNVLFARCLTRYDNKRGSWERDPRRIHTARARLVAIRWAGVKSARFFPARFNSRAFACYRRQTSSPDTIALGVYQIGGGQLSITWGSGL